MEMKKVTLFLAIVLISPIMFVSTVEGNEDAIVPDPQFDPSLGVDVPTYRVGDFWNYTTSFTIDILGFGVPFSGWMNMSVEYATLDFTSSDAPVYITNILGNISGALKLTFPPIDEKIYIDLNGYMWERIQDLSMYRMVLNATVSGTQSSINGNYPFGYEYDPPLEQYDFPLIPDEEWTIRTSARLPFGTSGDILDIWQNNSCGNIISRSVPAGIFDTYPVSIDGSPSIFYNETVGSTVERTYDLSISGISQSVTFELDEYHRQEEETRIRIWVDSEEPVWAGDTFDVSGELSTGNTVVTLLFPGSKLASTVNLVGPTTTFTRTLKAPMDMDDTPTDFDHGSFGILAVVGFLEEYDVCTVTTKAVDVMVNESSIVVSHEGNGTKDDAFTAKITIFNPSNYRVIDVQFNFSIMDGSFHHEQTIPIIEAHTNFQLEIPLNDMDPGNKTLLMEIDQDDQIAEYNETNNRVQVNFTVLERPELTYLSSIPLGDIFAYEGEWVNITAVFSRDDEPIPAGIWTIDGLEFSVGEDFNHSIPHLGNLSHREEPYLIEYHGNRSYFFEDENSTLRWDLHAENVNLGPEFEIFYPEKDTLIINETEWIIFGADIIDPEGETPYFYWIIDGVRTHYNTTEWVFTTGYLNNSSWGSPYTISVVAFDPVDPALNITRTWTVIVLDVDRPVSIEVTPEPGDLQIEHDERLFFEVSIDDPDMDPVNVTWSVEKYPTWFDTTFNISFEENEVDHEIYVDVEVDITVGNLTFHYNWTVHVLAPVGEPEPDPVAPNNVTILSPLDGKEYLTNETIIFTVMDEDDRDLTYRWLINGSFHDGPVVTISGLAPGDYTVILNVSTDGPPPGWIELSVSFKVVLPEPEVEPVEKEKDDPFPIWLVLLILLVISIVIALIAVVLLRKKDDPWNEE